MPTGIEVELLLLLLIQTLGMSIFALFELRDARLAKDPQVGHHRGPDVARRRRQG